MAEIEKLNTFMNVLDISNKVKELQDVIDSNFFVEEAVSYILMIIRHAARAGLRKVSFQGPNNTWSLQNRGRGPAVVSVTIIEPLVKIAISKIKEQGFAVDVVDGEYVVSW